MLTFVLKLDRYRTLSTKQQREKEKEMANRQSVISAVLMKLPVVINNTTQELGFDSTRHPHPHTVDPMELNVCG